MAYTKTLITDPRPSGFTDYDTERLYETISVVNSNLTAIETELSTIAVEGVADVVGGMVTGNSETGISVVYQDSDNTLDFAVAYGTEPGAVASSTSGQAGTADSASRSDHNHDLGSHAHTGATDGGALIAYQADLTASSTLGDMGVATIDPAFSGVLTGITTTSTLAQLLAAIDSHTHT